jgi:toxin YoeB
MKLTFENSAVVEDFFALAEDKQLFKSLKKLLRDIDRNPFTGIGKPERLKGRPGQWSRRIDKYHRIVYKIENGEIRILECGGHYEG